ncbi:MAG: hypothetical protein KatS3mg115_1168 [Candidatus Poribacteria bacterium]|nr:MAG: hypothetical protein KatS3mg115_1168 [Candidatus Poribacteria bacterium]
MEEERPDATREEPSEKSVGEVAEPARGARWTLPDWLPPERARLVGVIVGVVGFVLVLLGLWKLLFTEPELPLEPASPPASQQTSPAEEASSPPTDLPPPPQEEAEVQPSTTAMEPAAPESSAVQLQEPVTPEPAPLPAPSQAPERMEAPRPSPAQAAPRRTLPPNEEIVVLKPVEPLERPLSAYEQLMLSRRLWGIGPEETAKTDLSGETPVSGPLSAGDPAVALAFSSADFDFVKLFVEEVAQVPAQLGADRWEQIRRSPYYRRVLNGVYEYILTPEDKARLLSAYAAASGFPASTPSYLRSLPLGKFALQDVRREVWQTRRRQIEQFIALTLEE